MMRAVPAILILVTILGTGAFARAGSGKESWMPFGRAPTENPEELSKKQEEYRDRRRQAEEAGAPAGELDAIDLKLEELRLRRALAVKRTARDASRAKRRHAEAARLDGPIGELKKQLEAVRVRLRRAGEAAQPARADHEGGGSGAGSGAGSGSGH